MTALEEVKLLLTTLKREDYTTDLAFMQTKQLVARVMAKVAVLTVYEITQGRGK